MSTVCIAIVEVVLAVAAEKLAIVSGNSGDYSPIGYSIDSVVCKRCPTRHVGEMY